MKCVPLLPSVCEEKTPQGWKGGHTKREGLIPNFEDVLSTGERRENICGLERKKVASLK